jgi:ectoine hydroxylase-related dioxygenase (phytanoyl-CoA dioxygenase family)
VTSEQEFTDSTALRDRPDALTARLNVDGYLLVRQVLPTDAVTAVRQHVLTTAGAAGWLRPDGTADTGRAVWDPEPAYRAVHRRMWTDRSVHALMHHPHLLTLVSGLLGTRDVLVHPRKVLRAVHPRPVAAPGDGGWHQDWPEIQGSPETLTIWTPLAPAAPGTGALAVVPSSHRNGVLRLRLAATAVGWEAEVRPDIIHTGTVQPGDVLVFTSRTVHRGTSNQGDSLRLSLDVRYQRTTDPINETCLQLRDEPYGWDSVYEQWPNGSTDPLAHYWKNLPLTVVPYDTRYDEWREHSALATGADRNPTARRALEITAAHGSPAAAAEARGLLEALDA